jgi:hypothetical protein
LRVESWELREKKQETESRWGMKKMIFAVVVIGLLLLASNSFASVIFQDNFNLEHGGTGILSYNNFTNWVVTDGTVDLIGNGFYDLFPGNGLYVDLDGSTKNAGVMTTRNTIALAPGSYVLSFYLGGNHRTNTPDSVIVQSNIGSYSETFVIARNDPLTKFTRIFNITSSTNANLSFENLGGDNMGAILDNVELSAVPEPMTVSLLGLGLAGLLRLRKKRV